MSVLPLCDRVFVNIVLNLLRQLNLPSLLIKCNAVGICRSKEVFENLKRVTTEPVCLLATQFAWDAIF